MEVLAIIPAYNETHLQKVVDEVRSMGYAVLIIDDGSTNLNVRKEENVYVANHKVNLGQGAALQTGFELATLLNPAYVVTMDADGQHSATDISHLLSAIKEKNVDIVLGKRTMGKGVPLVRQLVLRFAILFNWLYTGIKLSDAHNGMRILSKKAYTTIRLQEAEMAHATEILEQVKTNNLSYDECSVKITYSEYSMAKGQSSTNAFSIVKNLIFRRL